MIREINTESPSFNHFLWVPAQKRLRNPAVKGSDESGGLRSGVLWVSVGAGWSGGMFNGALKCLHTPFILSRAEHTGRITELLPIKNPHGR